MKCKGASGGAPYSLPNQFEDLRFSIHRRRWRDQRDSIAMEFDVADQVPAYIVLN